MERISTAIASEPIRHRPYIIHKPMQRYICNFLLILIPCLNLAGCAGFLSEPEDEHADWSAERFYQEAKTALDKENYQTAIKLYEQLEARYPFGITAAQAQIDIAYAYYKFDEAESALAAADRFIKLHPRNPHVDYAYYLKGLVNFYRGGGLIDRFLPVDKSQRDPGAAREAYANFTELINKFPESRYLPDAKQRIMALRNNLALYEIHVARYYMKRNAYLAAAERCNQVIEKYQRTPAVPHALMIMEQAYRKLGLDELAQSAARVYRINYGEAPPPDTKKPATTTVEKLWDMIGFDE